MLARCPLWLAEHDWLSLCRLWAARASRRPEARLREVWLLTVRAWIVYLEDGGYLPDAGPDLTFRQNPHYREPRLVDYRREPHHLPFGFVKHDF